ncbi:MAG: class I SAM-dependent methyltransferase [Candidatus Parcubacteria bacterium]|nr:class I SAM-dependent methyltransferase [Candidatus Parcubacteria bacterium]
MANKNEKIFNQFHSSGMTSVKEFGSFEANLRNMAQTYEWNYKNFLPEDKKVAILDIGCGLGQFLSWLKEKGYKNFLGIDISEQMLNICKQNVTDKVEEISSLAEFLRNKNNIYDLVVLNDVIEHLPKNEIITDLEIIYAALKKGGRLLIKTNNLASITGARMRYSDFTHEVGFTEFSLNQVLTVSGFSEVEIKPFAMPLNTLSRILRFLLQKISNACWKFRFWVNFTPVPKIVDEMIFAIGTKD